MKPYVIIVAGGKGLRMGSDLIYGAVDILGSSGLICFLPFTLLLFYLFTFTKLMLFLVMP